MNDVFVILQQTVLASVPILLASIGEILTERSGVVNIGLEGLMLIGAFVGPAFVDYLRGTGVDLGPMWPLAGLLAAVLAGALVGLVHGYISTYLNGNQIVGGVAINLLGAGVAAYGILAYWHVAGYYQVPARAQMGPLPIVVFALATAAFMWYLLFKSRWGAVIRACGEDPEAAYDAGIDVYKVRIAATAAGASLASLAGAYLSMAYIYFVTKDISAGKGFIALANVVFANWNPLTAIAGALIFGLFDVLSYWVQVLGILPYQITRMIPYIATLLVALGAVRRAKPPKALGKPFRRE
ncbi:MAG: ABC transporter permease [Thermoproteus sp.]